MTTLPSITDNTNISDVSELVNHPIIAELVNQDLSVLDQTNFIIFPPQISDSNDLNKDNYIFRKQNNQIWTCNIVGILSNSSEELQIHSRFFKQTNPNDDNWHDYFLHYMLQKVLNYNVIDRKVNSSNYLGYDDLLVLLFPYYLDEALRKGIYKEYVTHTYNDANVKGSINIARQLKQNLPFTGRIAYHTREFSFDNNLTELIRHTIEKIKDQYDFVINQKDPNLMENIRTIKYYTRSYSRADRMNVLQTNLLNPIKHGYYEEYANLQKLCIAIINEEKMGFGTNKKPVYGLIIDVAWLWEAYIQIITGWNHYGRRADLGTLHLFTDASAPRYPDFCFNNIPLDTKYKQNLDIRNDYNQMTTYIHMLQSKKGGFIQPSTTSSGYSLIGHLTGGGEEMFTYSFYIPQEWENYSDFVSKIQLSEAMLNTINL